MKNIFKFIVHGFLILIPTIFHSSLSHAEVSFFAMGDSPYSNKGYYLIEKELKNIPKSAKFIIHLGDIKPKEKKCAERDYRDFRDLLKQSPIPVFVVPGDNGYDVCENKLKAKQYWDQYISEFEKHWKLKFLVKRQREQRENFSFLLESTLFIGINLFEKRDRDNIKFNKILKNNISWIKENLKEYQDQTKSLVVFAHDFSGLRNKNEQYIVCNQISIDSSNTDLQYKIFSDHFVSLANEFKKPILYMQGNHHCWTHDFPYKETKNIERIVVDKIEKTPLVQITIDGDKFKVNQRKNKRIDFFVKDANLGDVWSQYFLGKECLKIKDYKNAKKWFTKASNKNFPPAMMELGIKFREEKKYARALELFNSVMTRNGSYAKNDEFQVDKKNQIASWKNRIKQFKNKIIKDTVFLNYYHLGSMFAYGFGVPINYIKALEYYKIASEGNIGMSHYKIALMHYKGLGIRKDLKKAIDWFKKAASTGIHEAQFTLGIIYLRGEGVRQNYKEASKWFKKGKNFGPNLFELGILYWKGLGVKQDRKAAIQYFKKAAKFGIKEAIQTLENLGEISTNTE